MKEIKQMGKTVAVIDDTDSPGVSAELLAKHIEHFVNIGEELHKSRLKRSTIVLLLWEMTGIAKRDINLLLDAMPDLKKEYLKV